MEEIKPNQLFHQRLSSLCLIRCPSGLSAYPSLQIPACRQVFSLVPQASLFVRLHHRRWRRPALPRPSYRRPSHQSRGHFPPRLKPTPKHSRYLNFHSAQSMFLKIPQSGHMTGDSRSFAHASPGRVWSIRSKSDLYKHQRPCSCCSFSCRA